MRESRRAPRLVAIAVLAFLLFAGPLLSIADRPVRILGVPALYAYFFVAWALVIALVAAAIRR